MNKGVCGRMRRCGGRRGELAEEEEREVCVRQSAMRVELSVKKRYMKVDITEKIWSLRGVVSHASQETPRILLDHGQSVQRQFTANGLHTHHQSLQTNP